MKEKLDIEHMVNNAILERFSTLEVEQNLSNEASLQDDLRLEIFNIQYLSKMIEDELHTLGYGDFSKDEFEGWITVQDIINSVRNIVSK